MKYVIVLHSNAFLRSIDLAWCDRANREGQKAGLALLIGLKKLKKTCEIVSVYTIEQVRNIGQNANDCDFISPSLSLLTVTSVVCAVYPLIVPCLGMINWLSVVTATS